MLELIPRIELELVRCDDFVDTGVDMAVKARATGQNGRWNIPPFPAEAIRISNEERGVAALSRRPGSARERIAAMECD